MNRATIPASPFALDWRTTTRQGKPKIRDVLSYAMFHWSRFCIEEIEQGCGHAPLFVLRDAAVNDAPGSMRSAIIARSGRTEPLIAFARSIVRAETRRRARMAVTRERIENIETFI